MASPKCVFMGFLVLLCLSFSFAHRVLSDTTTTDDPQVKNPRHGGIIGIVGSSFGSGSGSGFGSGSGGSGFGSGSGQGFGSGDSGLDSGSGSGYGSGSGGPIDGVGGSRCCYCRPIGWGCGPGCDGCLGCERSGLTNNKPTDKGSKNGHINDGDYDTRPSEPMPPSRAEGPASGSHYEEVQEFHDYRDYDYDDECYYNRPSEAIITLRSAEGPASELLPDYNDDDGDDGNYDYDYDFGLNIDGPSEPMPPSRAEGPASGTHYEEVQKLHDYRDCNYDYDYDLCLQAEQKTATMKRFKNQEHDYPD